MTCIPGGAYSQLCSLYALCNSRHCSCNLFGQRGCRSCQGRIRVLRTDSHCVFHGRRSCLFDFVHQWYNCWSAVAMTLSCRFDGNKGKDCESLSNTIQDSCYWSAYQLLIVNDRKTASLTTFLSAEEELVRLLTQPRFRNVNFANGQAPRPLSCRFDEGTSDGGR
jgi:hypothetical protein